MSVKAVIDVARAYLGVTEEPPGSNLTIFGAEYGLDGQPWCVMFLWYCFQHAGERMAFFGGGRTASCSVLLRWYKEQGLTVPVEDVRVGDIVLLNFNGKGTPDHCGLVATVGKHNGDACVWTIEGNTTASGTTGGAEDNGGMVDLKLRLRRNIVGVCRPQYKAEEPQPVDDVSGHWYSKPIEWAKEKGLLEGYPDGSFKPNNPLTRAEACAMAERLYRLIMEDDGK